MRQPVNPIIDNDTLPTTLPKAAPNEKSAYLFWKIQSRLTKLSNRLKTINEQQQMRQTHPSEPLRETK